VEKAQHAIQQQNVSSGGVTSGSVGDGSVVEEKTGLVQKSLEMIELGLGEAQVGTVLISLEDCGAHHSQYCSPET
jgi:hypothetical protein